MLTPEFLMVNFIKQVIKNIRINLQRIAIEGLIVSLFLFLVFFVLVVNTIKIIEKGKGNYEIFEQEKNALEEVKKRNKELQREFTQISSDEYQKLLVRDVLGYAAGNENLYKTSEKPEFLEIDNKLVDVNKKENYIDWWALLIK